MGKIYYLMGKSSSGKDTVLKRLLSLRPALKRYVMYTTRPRRIGEMEGETYHFVSEEALNDLKAEGKLIESRTYETVEGPWRYATVDDGQMDPQNTDVITEGTLESFIRIRDYFGDERVVPLYLEVEDGERLERALRREKSQNSPSYKEMCRRFLADSEDFSEEKLLNAGISRRFINADLDECVSEILKEMK